MPNRAELLKTRQEKLAELERRNPLNGRKGFAFGFWMAVMGISAGMLGLSLYGKNEILEENLLLVGLIAAIFLIIASALFMKLLLGIVNWLKEEKKWWFSDRLLSNRKDDSNVPDELKELWDVRHENNAEISAIGLRMMSTPMYNTRSPLFFNYLVASIGGAIIVSIVAVIALVTIINALRDGNTLALVISSLVFLMTSLVMGVYYWSIIKSESVYGSNKFELYELGVYPLRKGNLVGERSTGLFNFVFTPSSVFALLVLIALLGTIYLRFRYEDNAYLLPLFFVCLLGLIFFYTHRQRTIPLVVDDINEKRSLLSMPAVRINSFVKDDKLIIQPQGRLHETLTLSRNEISGLINVRGAQLLSPMAVAVLGRDDVRVIVSGNKASKQIITWYENGGKQ